MVNMLSIWRFDTSEGADTALSTLARLQARRLVTIDDAAVVVWRAGSRRPNGYQVGTAAGTSALSGAFWGLLFGLLFLLPLAGATEATSGSGVLARIGLSDEFLAAVRDRITPGTSALFLLSDATAGESLREAFARVDPLVRTLDRAHVAALRRAFDADEVDDTDLVTR